MDRARVLRDALLDEANTVLARRHQELTDRQVRGNDVSNITQLVQIALNRVEALQQGVDYVEPDSPVEEALADIGARLIIYMLDGENAAERHAMNVLDLLDEIYQELPGIEERRWLVFRQGAPYRQAGLSLDTPSSMFDWVKEVSASSHEEAMEKVIERCDQGSEGGAWPPVQDGEIMSVVELNNRRINQNAMWVEKVSRPVYKGEAPRDNTQDPRFAG